MLLLTMFLAATAFAQDPPYRYSPGGPDMPALVLIPNSPESVDAEFKSWSAIAATRKWHLLMTTIPIPGDSGLKTLGELLADARLKLKLEKSPFYMVGSGSSAPLVFYAASRVPHLFSAALAISGSPKPAVDTDRIFGANTSHTAVAWAATPEERNATAAVRARMISAGYNLTLLDPPTTAAALDFLGKHPYEPWPSKIDCETGNPMMARCYWITATGFDPNLRNDAIRSTRVAPDSMGASLDFGAFAYKPDAPGPGIVVEDLPPKYTGPLLVGDRIVALSGKEIYDAKHYAELMSQITEEKPVSVTIERKSGKEKERIRLTTYYKLKKREEVVTARLQASYSPDSKEVTIISRTVAELQINIPEQWVPATINWNGNPMASPQTTGCFVISLKLPGSARPCPNSK